MKRNHTHTPQLHASAAQDVPQPSATHEALDFAQQLQTWRSPQREISRDLLSRTYRAIVASLQQIRKTLLKHHARRRSLALLEMQQLGDKRFVAVVRVGKQKFLIGGAPSSVSLLAEVHVQHTAGIDPRPLARETA